MKMKRLKIFSVPFLLILLFLMPASCGIRDLPAMQSVSAEENVSVLPSASEHDTGNTPVSEPVFSVPEDRNIKLKFLCAGDNIIYYGNLMDAKRYAEKDGRLYNFKPMYSQIQHLIDEADISFINQETLMAGEGYEYTYYPCFNSPQDAGLDLVDTGFNIINIANNHMADKGADGLLRTIEFWRSQPVMLIGGYSDAQDFSNIRVYEEKGVKIAMLAFTYGTNGLTLPESSDIVIPYLDKETIKIQAERAKQISDLVFASVHWGEENLFTPTAQQQEYAQFMADLGIAVIIGHHPHVIQPVKWIEGSGGNRTLCIYSLGNLAAEMANDYNMVGGIMTFDIVKKAGEKAYIDNPIFNATVFDFTRTFINNKVYLLSDYTAEQAQRYGISYYGNYTSIEKLNQYVTDTINSEFLP